MALNNGKKFEVKFKEDWKKAFPGGFIYRLPDQLTGYRVTSKNPCDFLCYVKPCLYLLECKSHKGNVFPWTALTQYDRLVTYAGIEGVRAGVMLWMQDHDTVVYLPIRTVQCMKQDNLKSFNIKTLKNDQYRIIEIPSIKRRVFLDSDYSAMADLKEGD